MPTDVQIAFDEIERLREVIEQDHIAVHDRHCAGRLLLPLNHTDAQALLRLPYSQLPHANQMAIRYRLGALGRSSWMKCQHGYLDKCLIAVSNVGSCFNGVKFCLCGLRGRLCKEPDYCPKCNLDQRVFPALHEYGEAYARAPFWAAVTTSSSHDASTAGLKLVTAQSSDGKPLKVRTWIPDASLAAHPRYTSDEECSELIERICNMTYRFADRLRQRGLIDGAYATREIDLDFRPTDLPGRHGGLTVCHHALAHGHMLVNSVYAPTWDFAMELYAVYIDVCQHQRLPAWPDLHISPVVSQAGLNAWIRYQLKSMPFHRWYQEAVVRGCNLEDLNLAFMQTVFSGIKLAFGNARSPNKSGNMMCLGRGYVGNQIIRLSPAEITAWTTNPILRAQHPEWAASIDFYANQRRRRCGQGATAACQ